MEELIAELAKYLEFLSTDQGLEVSVHFNLSSVARLPLWVWEKLSPYNSHKHPYCTLVKAEGRKDTCICCQREIIRDDGVFAYYKTCHAGVYQMITPIRGESGQIGFIAVSGYREDKFSGVEDEKGWLSLKPHTDFPKHICDCLIPPLKHMLEKLFSIAPKNASSEQSVIVQFLNEYPSASFEELCSFLGKSRSYVSHIFKKTLGVSFSVYRNKLRLKRAQWLLINTSRTVEQIGFDLGYNDTAYFISLFKKETGTTPLKFRTQQARRLQ